MIVPLTITQVNWPDFLRTVKQYEGRDIGRTLDLSNTSTGCPSAFIKVLKAFAKDTVSESKVLQQLHFSFLTDATDLDAFALEVIRATELVIVQGNLSQWQQAILAGCSVYATEQQLEFFNGAYQFFEMAGLKELWQEYHKQDTGNRTFYLCRKSL